MSFKDAQIAYDNMVEPSYWDNDNEPVYERLQENFDEDFITYEFSEKMTALLLKVCKQTASLDDFVEFKKEAADWYQSEFERYAESNYDKVVDEMKEEAADDEASRRYDDYCEQQSNSWYC